MDLTQLDIDNFIASTDPCIWKMLLLLTRSVRDASMPMATLTASNNKKITLLLPFVCTAFYHKQPVQYTSTHYTNRPVRQPHWKQ